MRLIDADALPRQTQLEAMGNGKYEDVEVVYANDIYNAPTIDAVPVRHGHWIKISPAGIYECSECQKNVMTSDIEAYVWCHGCGAMMDGGELSETD